MITEYLADYYLTAWEGFPKPPVGVKILNLAYASLRQILEIYAQQHKNTVCFMYIDGDKEDFVSPLRFFGAILAALHDITGYYTVRGLIVPDGVSWYAHLYGKHYFGVLGQTLKSLDQYRTSVLYNKIVAHYIKES